MIFFSRERAHIAQNQAASVCIVFDKGPANWFFCDVKSGKLLWAHFKCAIIAPFKNL